jgi:TolA-binding protein
LGDYERAVPPLQAFLRDYKPPPVALFPYDVDTNLRIGDAYFAMRQYGPAIDAYNKVTTSRLGGDYAMYQIAMAYDRAQQPYEAVNSFRNLIDNYRESNLRELAQFNIGYIYLLSNNHDQAVTEFESLIRLSPGSNWAARAQYNIGDAWYNAGEYQKAIDAYQVVLNRYPRSDYVVDAINSIRDAGLAIGMDDNTSSIMDQFLASNPNATTADRLRLSQARSLMESGDLPGAVTAYREIDRLTSDDEVRAEAQFNLADAYERQGNNAAAIAAYNTIVNQYSGSNRTGSALSNLGRLAYDSGDFAASLRHYEKLSNDHPRMRQEARVGMGNAYLALGDAAKARESFAAAGTGSSDAVRLGIAKADLAEGRYDQAETVFRSIAQGNSSVTGAEAQYQLGLSQQLAGRCNDAVTSFAAVKVLFGAYESIVARSMLANSQCYESLNNRVEAQRILRQLADEYPNTEAGREAARLLGNR